MQSSYGFAHIGRVGSVLMTLSVTVERFFAVAYPLEEKNLKMALIVFSVSGSVLYNLPRFFELETKVMGKEVVVHPVSGDNITVWRRLDSLSLTC